MNIAGMMKQAQAMQKKMVEAQEELAKKEYEGLAGGGVVKVRLSGKGEMLGINLAKELIDPNEVEILEDLIVAAFNDAKKKQGEDSENSMGSLMGGLNLPAGLKFPF
jgi:nucleoid-associated protein EbfC